MSGFDVSIQQIGNRFYVPSSRSQIPSRYDDTVIIGLFRLLDLVLLVVVGFVVDAVVYPDDAVAPWGGFLIVLLIGSTVAGAILNARGCYSFEALRSSINPLRRVLPGLLLGCAAAGGCLLLIEAQGSLVAVWLPVWLVASAMALSSARVLGARLVQYWLVSGRLTHRVAIIGTSRAAHALLDEGMGGQNGRIHVIGVYGFEEEREGDGDAIRIAGPLEDLLARTRQERIDAVVIALPTDDVDRIRQIVETLRGTVTDVHIALDTSQLEVGLPRFAMIGASPVLTIRERPLKEWRGLQKAIFDRLFSAVLLLLLLPLLGLITLAIRLDSKGPALFRQSRVGLNSRVFDIFKFRTMYHHLADPHASQQTVRGDCRVTRVGSVLRKLSLDELPQLLNVLRGEMSLVGPRPHALNTRAEDQALEDLVSTYAQRHRVLPGITGWAQVNGWRGELRTADQVRARVEHDIYYIENWSLLLDVKILLLTLLREIVSKRAF